MIDTATIETKLNELQSGKSIHGIRSMATAKKLGRGITVSVRRTETGWETIDGSATWRNPDHVPCAFEEAVALLTACDNVI